MNVRWKVGLHIMITLVIGIVIGAMLNRALVQRWIREALTMRGAGLRVPGAERMLKPTSPEQEAKIQAILDKHAQRLSQIHQRYGKELEAAFKSLKDEIDPVLTPEQRAQFEKMIPGPPPDRGRAGGFPGGWPPGGMPFGRGLFPGAFELALLKTELGLSEDQAAKIKSILDDFETRMQKTREAGGPPGDFEALGQLEKEKDGAIEKVLTDEQREKYRRLKSQRFERHGRPLPFP
jgi:Spy/CpxP family protein refolding chaperone